MWKHTNGFMLIDLFFTLSAMLLIATLFIPVMIHLYTDAHIENLRYEATQILYEEMMDNDRALPRTVRKDEMSFRLFNSDANNICISYFYQREVMICEKY
ncbi:MULTISPECIES: hypothetical protein [Cytobacillus]|uniref:Type II secretion system protein n=1 Tax=Cytobacillus stercorigallinarum TaxID=2762240 RepID=A0ABR8QK24_9BACI|nr:hypothetical protein [Cytobacillus stercorigallinarum]MBD7935878.1 hypothetical protein [Cytobacillus stercorigallinarum]